MGDSGLFTFHGAVPAQGDRLGAPLHPRLRCRRRRRWLRGRPHGI